MSEFRKKMADNFEKVENNMRNKWTSFRIINQLLHAPKITE